jgi:hypothetical protein
MRRIIIVALSVALLTTTAWIVHSAAAGSTAEPTRSVATTIVDPPEAQRVAPDPSEPEQKFLHRHGATATTAHQHPAATATGDARGLASQLAAARLATARYATSLRAAKAAGYQIITRMIPDMGWHYLNPTIQGFDVTRPPILVYERRGDAWQLGALEWVFTAKPATPPLPGATYGSFAAACHYKDGTFVTASSQDKCTARSPQTGAPFNFWHPDLVTLHVWLWYPNPAGLYNGTNPYIRPFNRG